MMYWEANKDNNMRDEMGYQMNRSASHCESLSATATSKTSRPERIRSFRMWIYRPYSLLRRNGLLIPWSPPGCVGFAMPRPRAKLLREQSDCFTLRKYFIKDSRILQEFMEKCIIKTLGDSIFWS